MSLGSNGSQTQVAAFFDRADSRAMASEPQAGCEGYKCLGEGLKRLVKGPGRNI